LKMGVVLDFEAKSTYTVTVNVDDATLGSGIDSFVVYTLTLSDVNEAPTAVVLTPSSASLAENASTASFTTLATIVVTDDVLGINTLSLTGTDAASFEIDGNQLRLKAGVLLDFETKPTYSVTVNVDDATVGSSPDATATFTLNITNANEAPTAVILTPNSASLAESASTATFTVLSIISITDDGAGINTLSLSGTDAGSFEIFGNELRLRAGVLLDFETKPTCSVTVNVDDTTVGSSPDVTATFTLTITNVNEAPTAVVLTPSSASVAENASTATFTTLATIAVTDDALGVNTLSLSGTDAASFEIFGNELRLRAGVMLDFETKPTYSVTVVVDDTTVGSTPDATAVFTLNITNVNEAPTAVVLTPSSASLAENASTATFTTLATILVTDDALGVNTLSLTGTDAGSFEIVGNALRLRAGVSLDFETKPTYSVTVNVDDATVGSTPDASASFTLNITNVNEAPTNIVLSNGIIAENKAIGTIVGVLSTIDPDNADTFGYQLVSGAGGSDNGSFTIDSNGQLRTNGIFDHETKSSYSILVRTTDQGGAFFEKQITVQVSNLLEISQPIQVGDGTAQRSVVKQLVVTFDHGVSIDPGAFLVQQRVRLSNGSLALNTVPVTFAISTLPSGGSIATVTFSGPLTHASTNALVDGNYQLTIDGSKVRIANTSRLLDADRNGEEGGVNVFGNKLTDNFFALLGDANGNGEVDAQDILGVNNAFRSRVGSPLYNMAYDINGNGQVDAQDILGIQNSFRKRRVNFYP